jgi:hypothetical protein
MIVEVQVFERIRDRLRHWRAFEDNGSNVGFFVRGPVLPRNAQKTPQNNSRSPQRSVNQKRQAPAQELDDRTGVILDDRNYISRVKSSAEPVVCGLSPGGSRIRTIGPSRTTSTRMGFSTWEGEIPRDTDSPLEGTGFEPSVPLLRKALLGVANRTRRQERRSTYRFRSETAMLAWSGCP